MDDNPRGGQSAGRSLRWDDANAFRVLHVGSDRPQPESITYHHSFLRRASVGLLL
jgi:hypothetical protein